MVKGRVISYMNWTYLAVLVVSLFSGIGNMPMYGRYYVADIPGFGWSGNFFINLYIHYLAGAVLLALTTCCAILYMQQRRYGTRLTQTGVIRTWVLILVIFSGVMAAIKNLPFVNLSLAGLMTVAFVHLGASMILIVLSIGCRLLKKPWTTNPQRHDLFCHGLEERGEYK